MPAASRLIMPARSIRRWLASSASAGASLSVVRKYCDTRMNESSSAKRAFYVKRSLPAWRESIALRSTNCRCRTVFGFGGSGSADDDHRQLGMSEYFLSFASEEKGRYAAAAMRCHDDRVAFLFSRGGQDRFPRRRRDGVNRGESDARRFCLGADGAQDPIGLLLARRSV